MPGEGDTRPMTYEEALALAHEIAESLGGRQRQALVVLARYASRGHKPSAMRLEAVRDAAFGAQHFALARQGLEDAKQRLDAGIQAIGTAAHTIRQVDVAVDEEAEERERERERNGWMKPEPKG